MSTLYYIGLPFKEQELTVEKKNIMVGIFCKLLIANINESPLKHIEKHSINFSFKGFTHLPPITLQYCLTSGIEDYDKQPHFFVKEKMTATQMYQKIQENPEHFGKLK
jgi:hypothetical protein